MFDNVANLVILAAILIGAFHFPREIVLYRMVPGTAVGVLVGDLVYPAMARRLARRTGRADVTAMPLGLNAPSVFGMSFAVLGPAYLATGDAILSWKMGMAVTVLVGLFGRRPRALVTSAESTRASHLFADLASRLSSIRHTPPAPPPPPCWTRPAGRSRGPAGGPAAGCA
jgi:hypothetical protein